ncbi:MAG: hypothetical protein KBT34_13660 [Prevotella sp.]|nr:hypothetical protein [Candidatus Prevotella equi]
MKKLYCEPKMAVVLLQGNSILAGSVTDNTDQLTGEEGSGVQLSKGASWFSDDDAE